MSDAVKKTASWPPPKLQTTTDVISLNGGLTAVFTVQQFNRWYAEYIEPLGLGVEVFGRLDEAGDIFHEFSSIRCAHDSHTAVLVGGTALPDLTADELLENLLNDFPNEPGQAFEKARAYLAKKRGEK